LTDILSPCLQKRRYQTFGFTIYGILQQLCYCQPVENPKVVSERLGHASIVLTLDTYSHVLPTMQQSATDKLEKMMFGT
jgi:integrase